MLDDFFTHKQQDNSALNGLEAARNSIRMIANPRRIILDLSSACNLACPGCLRSAAGSISGQLSYLTLEKIRWMEELFNSAEEVQLVGYGEATTNPEFCDILKWLDRFSIRKYLISNGKRLQKITQAIFRYHLDFLAISIDGATPRTNDSLRLGSHLEQLLSNIGMIADIRKRKGLIYPRISLNYTIRKANLDELPLLVDIASAILEKEDRIRVVNFTAFDEHFIDQTLWGREDELSSVLKNALERARGKITLFIPRFPSPDEAELPHLPCLAPWHDIFVSSTGFIQPCMSNPKRLGNIDITKPFSEYWDDIWNGKEYQVFRAGINTSAEHSQCARCFQESFKNLKKRYAFIQTDSDFRMMAKAS